MKTSSLAIGHEDRVLEVEALPRHERDEHVLPHGQLAHVGAGSVGEHVAGLDLVTGADDRRLVVASGLVTPLELHQRVDVRDLGLVGLGTDDDSRRVDALDRAVAARERAHAGVASELTFHARADERRVAADEGHGLALHVGAHEGAVRVVVLQEGHEGRGDAHHLVRRDVHQLDHVGRDHVEVAVEARRHERLAELALLVEVGRGLGDVLALFLEGRVPRHLVGDLALGHAAVRRLDEAELVDASEGGQRRDEADVRTFRGLDGADAAVVRGVDVADLEARSLAREAAGAERAEAALVRDLGERAAEVLLHHRGDWLRVDEVVRHERVDLLRHAHALFDGALHANQTDAVLVLHQLPDRADAAVAEVVDVVDRAATVLELDEVTNGLEDVLRREHLRVELRALVLGDVAVELVVQLEATDLREVVALRVEEQVVEEGLRRLERRGVTRTEATVDLHDRVLGRLDLLGEHGVAQVRTDVEAVDEEDLELLDARLAQLLELGLGDLFVDLEDNLASLLVDDVVRRDLPDQLLHVDRQAIDLAVVNLVFFLTTTSLPILMSRVAR